MKLDQSLVLSRWLSSRLGAVDIEDLKGGFAHLQPGVDGESPYLRALLEREGVRVSADLLAGYDERILEYEARLSRARGTTFRWKYFQYLALMSFEILLDALTSDPVALRAELNGTLEEMKAAHPHLADFGPFTEDSLRRLALYMATGSGKTLLLHANIWQVLHYLQHGAHPETLVRRPDGRREFDNVILVTPWETLSRQHIGELGLSGIDAVHLAYDEPAGWLFGPQVGVVEISKLRPGDEISGDGVSIPIESLGGRNLVFVDEGHKGTGSEAQTWKARQKALSRDGLLIEFSATFAQSVASARQAEEKRLLEEYGKAIVFDYSYRHFYNDGYGKHFEVLNLRSDSSDRAQELLIGGLLCFYQQVLLYQGGRDELRLFEVEPPLWVFLGAGVIKTSRMDLSDVAQVVAFLKRFLEDRGWAVEWIRSFLSGKSGFEDEHGMDLFASRIVHLGGKDPDAVYLDVLDRVFHGTGALEVWELKRAEGELALRASTPNGGDARYFALINVGDSGALRRHLEANADIQVRADEFTESLFGELDAHDSPLNVLIGSRKFIEGWSSWRVSTMGLLNMGRGAGPQVVQLFGRGVRLKGRQRSLQRATGRGMDETYLPAGLEHLETLNIFGWNADYIAAFRKMLEAEEVGWELELPVYSLFDPEPELYVPAPQTDAMAPNEPWWLEAARLPVRLDLTSAMTAMAGADQTQGAAGPARLLDFSAGPVLGLVDLDDLYLDLLRHKARRGYAEGIIIPKNVATVLAECDVTLDEAVAGDPERVQAAARRAVTTYLDRLAARHERVSEGERMRPTSLAVREVATRPYRVRGYNPRLREEILTLIADRDRLLASGSEPIPRLHMERHLFSPILLNPKARNVEASVSPTGLTAGEERFLGHLTSYWADHNERRAFADTELYVLRNLPRSGVGFFRRSGFYPDFLLWVVREEHTTLTFVEPHGMHHGGLPGNADKIESLLALDEISRRTEFEECKLRLRGYIVTETDRAQIPGADGKTWQELERGYRILPQGTGEYIGSLIGSGHN